jgi:predicted amidohydrolase
MAAPQASPSIRIALASPPFPRSVDDGMAWVERHLREAADGGAALVCFPESYIPGMRGIDMPVPPHSPGALQAALERARELARRHRIALILPMDWDSPRGIENVAFVIDAQGEVLGRQTKNQLDPSEDAIFVPGQARTLFEVSGLRFGVSICHEGFRYPESVRWAASRGASIVFHPHCTGSDLEGRRLTAWRAEGNPYFEHAMVCRALENEIYFASVNYPFRFQESATCIVSPSGGCVGRLPYGEPGVLIVDIDTGEATRRLAERYDPSLYA